ncbi:MAG TPA: hypothetical protein VME21_10840 [Steroidobacteraceae bacterium]|nr:hypothetical protein [Steroidobacteraceae bacterium]
MLTHPTDRRGGHILLCLLIALGCTGSLAGCGLAETGAAAAAGGASAVQQAQQAKATEDRVRRQVEEAMRVDAQHRADAEASAQ